MKSDVLSELELRGEAAMRFDGKSFEPTHDEERLTTQLGQVTELMQDGEWRTLGEIRLQLGAASEASISARLRDLRKPRFGSHVVERRRRGTPSDGLFEYRVLVREEAEAA